MKNINKPTLLVVSAGALRQYREYMFASLATEYELVLLDNRAQKWTEQYVQQQLVVDVLDFEKACCVVADSGLNFAGVFCFDELRVWHAAVLARKLGLPGPDPEAVLACRDKKQTRLLLAKAGVLQPVSVAVASLGEAVRKAKRIAYPVVVKPRALMASEGVRLVKNSEELEAAFTHAIGLKPDVGDLYNYGSVLIEQFVAGAEISVDGFVQNGVYHLLFVARKTVGFAPAFEEVAHTVAVNDTDLFANSALLHILQKTHAALGFEAGFTHVELRFGCDGPVVIEVNARLGGDLIPRVGYYATGIDAALVAAAVAVGRTPDVRRTRQCCAQIRFVYPPGAVEVEQVVLPKIGGNIVEAQVLVEKGDRVNIPPFEYVTGRLAYVIAAAEKDSGDIVDQLENYVANIKLRVADET